MEEMNFSTKDLTKFEEQKMRREYTSNTTLYVPNEAPKLE